MAFVDIACNKLHFYRHDWNCSAVVALWRYIHCCLL